MLEDVWETSLAINLTGLAYCMKHQIARMGPTGGSIVNISSGAGLEGVRGAAAYVASKHGVIGLTKTAALDHAKQNIRVNALCPGLIATPMTQPGLDSGLLDLDALCPMGRAGRPDEVAEAAAWLCSDRASYITGVALPVDGAHLAG
jgi:NAD(P)-dependent dehydrogenase (short-subunit alcohol dehydrogenase family)